MNRGRKLGSQSLEILERAFRAKSASMSTVFSVSDSDGLRPKLPYQFYNLQRNGYLRMKKADKNESFFHLTPKGKLAILKHLHLEKLRVKKWDRHWRIAIFDIPESLKKWREYLRYELRRLGFVPLQESVYITPCPVTGELDEILQEWGLRKYFRYLTVTEIDGEAQLKKKFQLK